MSSYQPVSSALGGKALNLFELQSIPSVVVPPFVVLSAHMSEVVCKESVEGFLRNHPVSHVAIRSSATSEDSSKASFAGVYATKLNVPAKISAILEGIEEIRQSGNAKLQVVEHYAKERGMNGDIQSIAVIVQEMISPEESGVIFSHSLSARDGYYVVSITKGSGDLVVSGLANGELVRIVRSTDCEKIKDVRFSQLVNTMRIIESHYGNDSLDVEFAFAGDKLYILQCRPITTSPVTLVKSTDESELARQLANLESQIAERYAGDVLGDMIDINPLELLGQNPSVLDVSIFRYLFADSIVEQIRRGMGYDPLDIGLIRVVGGKPYVSLRASAFSFRPKGVPTQTYERMLQVYRQQIGAKPCLQSSVEFDVFAMGCGAKLDEVMCSASLSASDQKVVRDAFQILDTAFVDASNECLHTLGTQEANYAARTTLLPDVFIQDMLTHVAAGTEQFVRVARFAFYWKSRFEERYPGEDLNELIAGHIQSVSTRMQADLVACRCGSLTPDELVDRYGHLRPGQFSMFGEAYADAPDHYLFSRLSSAGVEEVAKRRHPYEGTIEFKNVVAFMQAREETKFLFSQALHVFIGQLKVMLSERGISTQIAASMDWSELHATFAACSASPGTCRSISELPKHFPEVIIPGETCLEVVVLGEAAASYVTRASVKAKVQVLHHSDDRVDVYGKIVLIPYADPGYDFLFHSGVAGIISRVGGPASHMCIRAIELQIPACIGCGERMYEALASSETALLDCASQQIIPL